mgnify:FL=1
MSHLCPTTKPLPIRRAFIAVAILAVPGLLAAPASADPMPWHNPDYVAQSSPAKDPCDKQAQGRSREGSRSQRSGCPVRTSVTPKTTPNKAQIEYAERQAMQATPNKAQIEYAERQAMQAAR